MLKELLINNIAVIEDAEAVFNDGFNVLTGETGAGKSIIVDSINAVLGERTSRDLIRSECDKARVIAIFDNVSEPCKLALKELDVEDDDGQYIVQRTITSSGKNNCRINGVPVNTLALKEVGKYLINIHGQHDNQQLLSVENHCKFLDAFAENDALLDDYKNSFDEFREVRKQLKTAIDLETQMSSRIEILKFQINELENADIKVGETATIKERITVLENSEKLNSALDIISGSDVSDSNYLTELESAEAKLIKLNGLSNDIDAFTNKLSSAILELKSLQIDSKKLTDIMHFDPEELEMLQNRLDFLHTLMRKYDGDEQDLLNSLENFKSQLDEINVNTENKIEFENRLVELQNQLIMKAKALSKSRLKASEKLSSEVCEVLKFLDMENVTFKVNMVEGSYNSTGTDRVEFLISTNKGQSLMPLSKIASGGELSRIMLAIKSVLADKDNVDTLIFDEIDTGISGRAARKIGVQLKNVSKLRQVICITHLPLIAALADNHLLITKAQKDNATYTSVKSIIGDERIHEVARIMSGSDITENLYNTAKELIENE